MKKLILVSMLVLTGCGSEPEDSLEKESLAMPTSEVTTELAESELSPDEAKKFATDLLQKIDDDEQAVRAAYEQKDTASLDRYSTETLVYINPNPNDMFDTYWIDSDVLDPYVKCDTALRDLYIYTGSLSMQLKNDTESLRDIAKKEEQDYIQSKTQCEDRVAMSYEEAKQADEKES